MLKVTDKALEELKQLTQNYEKENGHRAYIQIGIEKQKCGLAYTMEYSSSEEGVIGEFLRVTKTAAPLCDGITLDYNNEGCEAGFEFISDTPRKTCCCGVAFSDPGANFPCGRKEYCGE